MARGDLALEHASLDAPELPIAPLPLVVGAPVESDAGDLWAKGLRALGGDSDGERAAHAGGLRKIGVDADALPQGGVVHHLRAMLFDEARDLR